MEASKFAGGVGGCTALGVPALVQAQLFPLAPIQRQRPPCPMEDPVYGLYRQQYFGHFPTCWRTFPPGWGCVSPEAPNAAREFAQRKRDPLPETGPGFDQGGLMDPLPGEGQGPATPRGRGPAAPLLPTAPRSPFELPPDPGANPRGAWNSSPDRPGGGGLSRLSRSNPPTVPATSSPIELPQAAPDEKENAIDGAAPLLALPEPAEAATTPTPAGTGVGADPLGHNGDLPAPNGAPGASTEPVPTLPEPGAGVPRPVMNPSPVPPQAMETPVNAGSGMPVQAPQRRGPISSLFNNLTSWLRR